jgi:hypothetical protein
MYAIYLFQPASELYLERGGDSIGLRVSRSLRSMKVEAHWSNEAEAWGNRDGYL